MKFNRFFAVYIYSFMVIVYIVTELRFLIFVDALYEEGKKTIYYV